MTFPKILRLILFLSLGAFLVYFSIKDFSEKEIEQVFTSFKTANPFFLLGVFIISLLSHIIRAYRWKLMLINESEKVSLMDMFWALMAGYLANLAFPRLGEITRCGLLNKYNKVDFSYSIGTVVFERIFDVLCLGICLLLCIWIEFDVVFSFFNTNLFIPILNKLEKINITWLILLAVVMLVISIALFRFLKNSNNKFLGSIKSILLKFSEGFVFLKNNPKPFLFLLLSFGIWFFYYFGIIVGYYSNGEMNQLGWGSGLSLLIAGAVAMIIVQGGIGAYPLALMQVLLLYSINKSTGLAFGWIIWTLQTLVVLVFGAFGFGYFELKKLNKKG